jgi:hypothetical protein
MSKRSWQLALVIGAIVSLLIVIVVLLQVVLSPYVHGGPAKVVTVNAGPYPLRVTLYNDPANAGYALPFAIQAPATTQGKVTYDVSAIPAAGTGGSVVHGDMSANTTTADGTPGNVNVTVRGNWTLHILVNGPQGQGEANVAFAASAPPAIPVWFAWLIGFVPLYGILLFLFAQWRHNRQAHPTATPATLSEPHYL